MEEEGKAQPIISKKKTVMFQHILEVADDNDKLIDIAEQWDGTNMESSLNPTAMLVEEVDRQTTSRS